jgi:tetratricopeptide (TPR) repeat protein
VELNVHLVLEKKPTRQEQKLKTLSQYVQQYPSGWKKRLELANVLSIMGYWERAVEEYRQVIERQPQLIAVRLKLAKLLLLMARESEAIEVYESTLALSRHEATQQHIRGLIALHKGDTEKAILSLDRAASLEPDNSSHWLVLGQLQMGRENPVEALRAFNAILSINPDDIVALIHSYDALIALGNFQQAQRRLNKLIVLAPDDCRVLQRQLDRRCAMRLVSGEEGKQTKKMINSLLRQAPHGAEAHKSLAYYHIFRGDWTQGLGVLAQFTQEHPNNPRGWYYYGRCLFHTGDYQKAAEVTLKAYHLYPNDCEIYRALCEILPLTGITSLPLTPPLKRGAGAPLTPPLKRGAGGDLQTGEGDNITLASILEEMLERFPQRWSVWATAGRVLVESLKEIERGCQISFQGTQLQPLLPDAWFRHGRVLAFAGKHQDAVDILHKGWGLLPEEGSYLQSVPAGVWLGESYQMLGDDGASRHWWQEACHAAEKLLEFYPTTAYYWQGRALEGLGDTLGAMKVYQSALSQEILYPAHREVEGALKRLKTLVRKGYRP